MKAIAYTRYGPPDVLQLQERPTPSPKNDEVLVKVHASSVNAMEWRPFTFPTLFLRVIAGWSEPRDKTFGGDFAGTVEAVGPAVTRFRPGDDVFGICRGAFAEYVCVPESKWIVGKPTNVSFEAAATVGVAAVTALQAVRNHGRVQPGQHVLINGAGGGVGTFAVQIAKALGAEVTAVCGTGTQDVARSLGADRVVDYTKQDVTRSDRRYDVIVAANGHHSLWDYKRVLTPRGRLVVLGGSIPQMLQTMTVGVILSRLGGQTFRPMLTRATREDLSFLKDLLESGKVVPAIDRSYPLAALPDAIRYLMAGHAGGKVVITVPEPMAAPPLTGSDGPAIATAAADRAARR